MSIDELNTLKQIEDNELIQKMEREQGNAEARRTQLKEKLNAQRAEHAEANKMNPGKIFMNVKNTRQSLNAMVQDTPMRFRGPNGAGRPQSANWNDLTPAQREEIMGVEGGSVLGGGKGPGGNDISNTLNQSQLDVLLGSRRKRFDKNAAKKDGKGNTNNPLDKDNFMLGEVSEAEDLDGEGGDGEFGKKPKKQKSKFDDKGFQGEGYTQQEADDMEIEKVNKHKSDDSAINPIEKVNKHKSDDSAINPMAKDFEETDGDDIMGAVDKFHSKNKHEESQARTGKSVPKDKTGVLDEEYLSNALSKVAAERSKEEAEGEGGLEEGLDASMLNGSKENAAAADADVEMADAGIGG